jgi:thymidylate synthase
MFRIFEGITADEVWQEIASAFQTKDRTAPQKGRGGKTQEILHAALSISDPRQRWITSRQPALNPAFAIAEIIWILRGRNDSAFLNFFNSQLPKYAGRGKTYHGAYGYRLRHHFGIDQLDRACRVLKKNPESRQVVLQIWDDRIDIPRPNGQPSACDIPCNLISLLKVRNGALEWTQIMRSNDLFRGLPHNVVQFTTIQEVMAGWLGLELGSYNHISDSLHVYEDAAANIQHSVPIEAAPNSDSLMLPKKQSERAFAETERITEMIIKKKVSTEQLMSLSKNADLPLSFRNMVCVLCAEGARRRKSLDVTDEIMSICTNPLYRQLFSNWQTRCATEKR